MCSYIYSKRSGLKRCYADVIVEEMHNHGHSDFNFPHDSHGICVFHSTDLEWKKDIFASEFKKLIEAITELKEKFGFAQFYDFREFHFYYNSLDSELLSNCKLDIVQLDDSVFYSNLLIKNSSFEAFYCDDCHFKSYFTIQNSNIERFQVCDSKFDSGLVLNKCEIKEYSLFRYADINKFANFKETVFNGSADFSGVKFANSESNYYEIQFDKTIFNGELNFTDTIFEVETSFENTIFNNNVIFLDTNFSSKFSTTFEDITFNGFIVFKSTNTKKKLFSNLVYFSIKDSNSINGRLIFDNADITKFSIYSKKLIYKLEKEEIATIESNCEKYPTRTKIYQEQGLESLQKFQLELLRIFSDYFQSIFPQFENLGVEIVDKTPESISYFFFTDTKIDPELFECIIQNSTHNLWDFVSLCVQNSTALVPPTNIVLKNTLIDLAAIFMKLKNYVNNNLCTEEDIKNCLHGFDAFSPVQNITETTKIISIEEKNKELSETALKTLSTLKDKIENLEDMQVRQGKVVQELIAIIQEISEKKHVPLNLQEKIALIADSLEIGDKLWALSVALKTIIFTLGD